MSATRHRLVDGYVAELREAVSDLPRKQREELVAEVSSHLEATIPLSASEAEVLTALDRFGDPEQIADAERERLDIQRRTASWREWLAIPLLLFGGLILPVIGWVIGLVLLWISQCWSVRDKLIGTLVVPGGLLAAVVLPGVSVNTETCSTGTSIDSSGHRVATSHCTGGLSTGAQIAGIALELFLIFGPIATAIYLGRRLPRR